MFGINVSALVKAGASLLGEEGRRVVSNAVADIRTTTARAVQQVGTGASAAAANEIAPTYGAQPLPVTSKQLWVIGGVLLAVVLVIVLLVRRR